MKMRGYHQGNQGDNHSNFTGVISDDSKPMEDVLGSKDTLDSKPFEGGGYGTKDSLDGDHEKDLTADILNNG